LLKLTAREIRLAFALKNQARIHIFRWSHSRDLGFRLVSHNRMGSSLDYICAKAQKTYEREQRKNPQRPPNSLPMISWSTKMPLGDIHMFLFRIMPVPD
jgi:hypothetical protein